MSDYKLTRDAAGNVTSQYGQMLRNLDDDLVKRLRQPWDVDRSIMSQTERWMAERKEAAARIEELEEELEEQVEWVRSLAYDLIAAEGREARLKEKLEKAVDALKYALQGAEWSYYGINFEENYAEELATLAELEGET